MAGREAGTSTPGTRNLEALTYEVKFVFLLCCKTILVFIIPAHRPVLLGYLFSCVRIPSRTASQHGARV